MGTWGQDDSAGSLGNVGFVISCIKENSELLTRNVGHEMRELWDGIDTIQDKIQEGMRD